MPPPERPLEKYRQKRSADRTAEPFGATAPAAARPRLFVVQKHKARRLHYDFRLEWGGVLWSWAVPKGPSFDPAQKRLAVHVEDHPVEYADFEGTIAEGNYGAGAVIVWDQGVWLPLEDPEVGLEKGKLLFELRGYKLRGVWTLVRTKGQAAGSGAGRASGESGGTGKDWLLIKHADAWSAPEGQRPVPQESIFSGLTLEELAEGKSRADEIRADLEKLGAPRRAVSPKSVIPMLAEVRDAPFSKKDWIFELKYDGFRLLASRPGTAEPRLFYRRGSDSTAVFPEIARVLRALPFDDLLIDGEVCVLDSDARPKFQLLQRRVQLSRPRDIERASVELPATYYVFDLIAALGYDLRALPLLERKRILRKVLPAAGPIRFADHIEEHGEALFAEVQKLGVEGIVGKKSDSPYRTGQRSADWQKIRIERTGDFVIVGFTEPKRGRAGFGALHVGAYESDRLLYCGRVGTGFSDEQLDGLRKRLEPDRRRTPAFEGPLPGSAGHVWVEPKLACEVRYKERTNDHMLRHPVFVRLREDKPLRECIVEHPADLAPEPKAPAKGPALRERAVERHVPYTHLDKVFWPEEGYTKGDLIEFYKSVGDWILPYLRDRPVVLTRFPDGIHGKSFFQKDAPGFVPGWVRTERMWSEHAQREIDYFVADDVETLAYLVNLGTIPLHVWSSRVADLQHPDWCILDLDPKGAPFSDVIAIARAIKKLCDAIEMPSFVKTSGSTGLHILLPLGGQCTYEQSRSIGELFGRVIVAELPDIATIVRPVGERGGRVYIDFLQNGHGRLLVAPLSVRPLPKAPVSTPISWSEVTDKLRNGQFAIRTVPPRLRKQKRDPLLGVLSEKPDLSAILERLSRRLG